MMDHVQALATCERKHMPDEREDFDQPAERPSLADLSRSAAAAFVCAKCGGKEFRVFKTVPSPGRIFRKRRCVACGHVVHTMERLS